MRILKIVFHNYLVKHHCLLDKYETMSKEVKKKREKSVSLDSYEKNYKIGIQVYKIQISSGCLKIISISCIF